MPRTKTTAKSPGKVIPDEAVIAESKRLVSARLLPPKPSLTSKECASMLTISKRKVFYLLSDGSLTRLGAGTGTRIDTLSTVRYKMLQEGVSA